MKKIIVLLIFVFNFIYAQANYRFGFLNGYGQNSLHPVWQDTFGLSLFDSSTAYLNDLDIHWGREFFLIYPVNPPVPSPIYQSVLNQSELDSLETIMVVATDSATFFSDSLGYRQWLIDIVNNFPGVDYFQVHNEVGKLNRFENPDSYIELLKFTSNTLRTHHPTCNIIMGSTIPDSAYYNRLLSISADDYVDAYDFHLFDYNEMYQLQLFISALNTFGISKKVFMTEMSTYSGQPLRPNGLPDPSRPFQSEQQQAQLLIKMFARSFSLGVDYIFWSSLVEWYKFNGDVDGFFDLVGIAYNGLPGSSGEIPGSKKEAYTSIKILISKIDQFSLAEKIADGQHRFYTNHGLVYVLWSDSGSYTLPSGLPDSVLVTDYLGNSSIMPTNALTLSNSPLFVETNINSTLSNGSQSAIIENYQLYQNYPNPFNATTAIEFMAPVNSQIKLTIFNTAGQVVKVYNINANDNNTKIIWNGTNENGEPVSSGVYIYRLETAQTNFAKKLLLLE